MSKHILKLSLVGIGMVAALETEAITIDFNSISGPTAASRGSIQFAGATDTFKFVNATTGAGTGFSFTLSGSDGVGDSFGDLGKVNGVFKIGAITIVGTKQTAPVTLQSGLGTLVIDDGLGNQLSGDIDWLEIFTDGTAGGINSGGSINLKNITYAGPEADLLSLHDEASASVQFGFNPGKSLTTLISGTSVKTTTFTGDLYATPDGGSTSAMLGMALLGFVGIRRKLAA